MFEIEKKYLIKEGLEQFTSPNFSSYFNSLNELVEYIDNNGEDIIQGYFSVNNGIELVKKLELNLDFVPSEARVRQKGNKYFFTMKSDGLQKRNELETTISQDLFENIYSLTETRVEKKRLKVNIDGLIYEFDKYLDRDLIVVEIEVNNEKDLEKIIVLGKDITEEIGFKNKNLAK